MLSSPRISQPVPLPRSPGSPALPPRAPPSPAASAVCRRHAARARLLNAHRSASVPLRLDAPVTAPFVPAAAGSMLVDGDEPVEIVEVVEVVNPPSASSAK